MRTNMYIAEIRPITSAHLVSQFHWHQWVPFPATVLLSYTLFNGVTAETVSECLSLPTLFEGFVHP